MSLLTTWSRWFGPQTSAMNGPTVSGFGADNRSTLFGAAQSAQPPEPLSPKGSSNDRLSRLETRIDELTDLLLDLRMDVAELTARGPVDEPARPLAVTTQTEATDVLFDAVLALRTDLDDLRARLPVHGAPKA